jgi:periplasmic divalent cation tolerance protein
MGMAIQFVYVTAASSEDAEKIGRTLLDERLAACVNILDGMRSLYWWEGKIDEADEAVLIVKTEKSLVPSIIKRVEEIHPYKTPCAVALEVPAGSKNYLKWIESEVETAKASSKPRKPSK